MRKILMIWCLLFATLIVHAQFNNEWIDYSKTYYKFKVGKDSLYRISQSTLSAAGLGIIPAEQFQLWRNGVELSIYTSVASGVLPANGYIEFWGQKNDGKPDRALYKNPNDQLSNALSLETDTAVYFLTVNASGNNLRITDAPNNVAGNSLSPEPYLMYDYVYNYQQQINPGKAVDFGEYVYSSTYDVGEFWTSHDITSSSSLQLAAGNLFVATTGPNALLKVSAAGNSVLGSNRNVKVDVNGSQVINSLLQSMNASVLSNNAVAPSLLGSNTNFTFSINNTDPNDRASIGFVD